MLNAIIESQETGKKISREALITTKKDGRFKSLDLKIISTPISLKGHQFLVLVIQDISNEKRRHALERIFFHDLLNSAGGLNGLLSLLKEGNSPRIERQLIDLSVEASHDIIEEIQQQRQIYAAEAGELQINLGTVNSIKLINSIISKTGFHQSGRDRKIIITKNTADIDFETDISVIRRVIINMLKNAFEATLAGGTVEIGAEDLGDTIRFRVKNEIIIPKEIQMQLFLRSFSTKGIGRGLGTYSIRLLTENYLRGRVSFVSNESDRAIFMIDLFKKFPVE